MTLINNIHPSIRVTLFLLLAASFTCVSIKGVVTGGLLLTLLYLHIGPGYFKSAYMMFRRLRWLLISILVIYFCFTPGQVLVLPYFEGYTGWMPTEEGVTGGLERVLSLAVIVMAVNLLLCTTSREQLLSAIYWLATPLSFAGISRDRLAARMVMVMGTLPMVQKMVFSALSEIKSGSRANAFSNIASISSSVFRQVLDSADKAPCDVLEIPVYSSPPVYQWLYPIVLSLVFLRLF